MVWGDLSEKVLEPGGIPPGLLTFTGLPPLAPFIQIVLKKLPKNQFLINYKIHVPAIQLPPVCFIVMVKVASKMKKERNKRDRAG